MIVVKVAISPDSSSACSTPVRTVTSEPSSAWIRRVSSSGVTPSSAATWTESSCPSLSSSFWAVGTSRIANVAPPIELRSPYLAIPTISELLGRADRGDADLVAELQVLALGHALVDRDLTVAGRPAALDEIERVEAVVLGIGLDPEGEGRRAAGLDRLPVGPQQLGLEVQQRAGGHLDAVDGPDAVERLLRDRRRLGALALEADAGLLPGDDDVGAGVRLDEDRVERLVDRVREDVGAAHHRDAEDDRERGEDGAELPPRHAAEGDPDHVRAISSSAVSTSCSSSPGELLDDLAVGEEEDAVGRGGRTRLVRDHDERLAVVLHRRAQQLEDLAAGLRVEVAGRLVREDDGRPAHERAGDRDALLLAAGELGRAVRAPVLQADLVEQVLEEVLVRLRPGEREREGDVLLGGQHRQQVEELEDEADVACAEAT